MLKSHRLVRDLYYRRKARRDRAADFVAYDHVEEATSAAQVLRELERAGLCDPVMMEDFQVMVSSLSQGIVERFSRPLLDAVADDVAARLFAGKTYRNRLDRQLCGAAAAVAASMFEERLMAGLFETVRQFAKNYGHEDYPASPPAGPDEWSDAR